MGNANRLLGYPPDARLLIINCDDLGFDAAANAGVARALECGVARSTSLMVPCPGAPEAMRWLAAHPETSFGVHVTLVRDGPQHIWPPLSPREKIPSLLGPDGQFRLDDGSYGLSPELQLSELERETRAQIEAVLAAELSPVHVDWHCVADGGRADVFDVTLALAREYGLALRVTGLGTIGCSQRKALPTADRTFLDSFSIATSDKPARYFELLHELPEGLNEWALHPADPAGATARNTFDREVRAADLSFLSSAAAREAIAREGIILLDYRALQKVWRDVRC